MSLRIANLLDDQIPIELEGFNPVLLADRSLDGIRRFVVRRGNRECEAGELFRIEGDPSDGDWLLEGDCRNLHGLGAKMTGGRIVVDGPLGRRAGCGMRGGRVDVCGDAGDWLGAEMAGGVIRVRGNAGSRLGAHLLGSRRGMAGGTILVDGDAGSEVGMRMRRGLIAVAGSVGANLGFQMLAGTILVFSRCAPLPGMAMRRGTIGVFGDARPTMLPSFRVGYRGSLPALRLLQSQLACESFALDRLERLASSMEMVHGDFLHSGRGEALLT